MGKVVRNVLYEVVVRTKCVKSSDFCSLGSNVSHGLGYFDSEELANKAIELYKKALKYEKMYEPIGDDIIEMQLFPEDRTPGYYKTLFEFINGNNYISKFNMKIGVAEMKKVLAEINGEKRFSDEQERIIKNMIYHYQEHIKESDKKARLSQVEEYKKYVKFLEDLRDGKIEL